MSVIVSASDQATHDELHAASRHCVNMGGECARPAHIDVRVTMTGGREVTLRLCAPHADHVIRRGLRNAVVTSVSTAVGSGS